MSIDTEHAIKVLEHTLKFQLKNINDKLKELKQLEYEYKITVKNILKLKAKQ